MPELSETGQVETRADGSKVFTHGHRFPDNMQKVVQEYDAAGQLTRVQVEFTGFAGKLLDVSAQVDKDGNVLKEEGYRAPEMTMGLKELIKPLPAETRATSPSASESAPKEAASVESTPVTERVNSVTGVTSDNGIRRGLERIYGKAGGEASRS